MGERRWDGAPTARGVYEAAGVPAGSCRRMPPPAEEEARCWIHPPHYGTRHTGVALAHGPHVLPKDTRGVAWCPGAARRGTAHPAVWCVLCGGGGQFTGGAWKGSWTAPRPARGCVRSSVVSLRALLPHRAPLGPPASLDPPPSLPRSGPQAVGALAHLAGEPEGATTLLQMSGLIDTAVGSGLPSGGALELGGIRGWCRRLAQPPQVLWCGGGGAAIAAEGAVHGLEAVGVTVITKRSCPVPHGPYAAPRCPSVCSPSLRLAGPAALQLSRRRVRGCGHAAQHPDLIRRLAGVRRHDPRVGPGGGAGVGAKVAGDAGGPTATTTTTTTWVGVD